MASRTASYLRIATSAAAWYLIQEHQPHSIAYVLGADAVISLADSLLIGNKNLGDRLLSNVADVMMMAGMIFSALIKQKMTPFDWYSQMYNQDWLTLRCCWCFALIFCSRWFNYYSIILAGDRSDKIGTTVEHMLCDFATTPLVDRVFYVATNLFFYLMYVIQFYSGDVQ